MQIMERANTVPAPSHLHVNARPGLFDYFALVCLPEQIQTNRHICGSGISLFACVCVRVCVSVSIYVYFNI